MTYTDIKTEGWISRLPEQWQPYALLMRLDRPIGWWLLLLPGWWGIVLGANGVQGMYGSDFRMMITFLCGAVIMRGAGCIINDLWDRDLDKQVERTKLRPLASGEINLIQAGIFLFSLLFTGFIILLQTAWVTIGLGMLAMLFVVAYPVMKRITWWPQAFLGLTFNFGALMGWGAATSYLGLEAFTLYIAGIFWTLGYDTVYAHQDKADDELVGIKSTARLFEDRSPYWIGVFYMLSMAFLFLTALIAHSGLVTYALLIIPAMHLMNQLREWDMYDPENSLVIFKSNRNFGLYVLLAFAAHGVIAHFGLPVPDLSVLVMEQVKALLATI